MSTNLDVTLSAALQAELDKPGTYAYAVWFDANHNLTATSWTDLVVNGTIENGGTDTIALPQMSGGKVYFLVQSVDPTQDYLTGGQDIRTGITQEGQINWGSAVSNDFSYDSFEFTLSGQATDQGNMTAVYGFGLPMELSVDYASGSTATVGFALPSAATSPDPSISGNVGTATPGTVFTYTAGPLSGTVRELMSPTVAVGDTLPDPPPFNFSDWDGYIDSLKTRTDIVISGMFNGAPSTETTGPVWHNGGYFAYALSWDEADGVFWLNPLTQSQIKGSIKLTPTELAESIYSTLGTVDIYASPTDSTPFLAGMNTGANNEWGKVLGSFLTGFTAGFYTFTGVSPNPQITDTVNLDQNNNWDPTYSFGQNHTASAPTGYQTFDPYSQVFFTSSNSYGSNYSDAVMKNYSVGGPLVSLGQSIDGVASDVGNIALTLFGTTETPSGYVQPVMYNYVAPRPAAAGVYDAPDPTLSSSRNIVLDFTGDVNGYPGVTILGTDTVTLRILASDAGGVPVWRTLTFDGSTAGPLGLWQEWTIGWDSGTSTYTATPLGNATKAGSMTLGGFPTAQLATGAVSWYQIQLGTRVTNLYVTTDASGNFVNPDLAGQAGAMGVDGLAKLTPGAAESGDPTAVHTFTVVFGNGDVVAIDPTLLGTNDANVLNQPMPDAPVAGTLAGTIFTALPGQTNQVSNTLSIASTSLAFGWTGDNSAPNTNAWISGYTNKVDGQTFVKVTLHGLSNDFVASGVADVDGEWTTSSVAVVDDTYTVTMQDFADAAFTNALTPVSSALTLTVTADLIAPCFAEGTEIATANGPVAVQHLRVGERLRTASGRLAPVKWIGHRTLDCTRHSNPADVHPVRIRADAFGPGAPARDLLLSPDHAVFVDGVLIPVRYLVNGATIAQEAAARITYWHVELDRHDVLLAEGLACESYLDTGNRFAFANGGGALQMHPDFALRIWEAKACATLVLDGAELVAARSFLLERAARLGHTATDDPDLCLEVDGRRIRPVRSGGTWRFRLPAATRKARLVSRSGVPAETREDATDHRRLGVAVSRIACDGRPVPLGRFCTGWHRTERAGNRAWRWTDGNAALALPAGLVLEVEVAFTERYWQEAQAAPTDADGSRGDHAPACRASPQPPPARAGR